MEAAATVENRNSAVSHRGLENAPRFPQLPQPTPHGVDQRQLTAILSPRHAIGTRGGMLLNNRAPMVLKTDTRSSAATPLSSRWASPNDY